jgi:hypothetical protein
MTRFQQHPLARAVRASLYPPKRRTHVKVNFDAAILDLDDKPMAQAPDNPEPATLKHVCMQALQANDPRAPDDSAKKLRCFELLLKLRAGGEQDITPEDATLMKEKVAIGYGPMIMGRAFQLLNG